MVRPRIKPRVKPRVRPSIQRLVQGLASTSGLPRWIAAVALGELLALSGAIAPMASAQIIPDKPIAAQPITDAALANPALANPALANPGAGPAIAAQSFGTPNNVAAQPNGLRAPGRAPLMASPLGLQSGLRNAPSPCAWIMRQGRSIDLTQMCGDSASAPLEVRLNPNAILAPRSRSGIAQTGFSSGDRLSSAEAIPSPSDLPSYGVIFIDPVPLRPVAPIALTGRVGNATAATVQDVRILYDVVNPGDESPEGVLVQAQKSVDINTLAPGQQSTFTLTLQDLEQALPGSLAGPLANAIPKLALRITQVAWTEVDQSTGLASPQSVRYAQGMGRCHFPWEKGGLCQGVALSERFYRPIDGSTYASADRSPTDRIPDTIPLLRAE